MLKLFYSLTFVLVHMCVNIFTLVSYVLSSSAFCVNDHIYKCYLFFINIFLVEKPLCVCGVICPTCKTVYINLNTLLFIFIILFVLFNATNWWPFLFNTIFIHLICIIKCHQLVAFSIQYNLHLFVKLIRMLRMCSLHI